MHSTEKANEFRKKMIEHLEAALSLADETQDSTTRYLIERAIDQATADLWPLLDPWPKRDKP
jgi:DNA-binding ferritin-like protein